MVKQWIWEEKKTEKSLLDKGVDQVELYDLVAFLIKRHGLQKFSLELKNFLSDNAETAFAELVPAADGSCYPGTLRARGLEVVTATAASLVTFAEEYKL